MIYIHSNEITTPLTPLSHAAYNLVSKIELIQSDPLREKRCIDKIRMCLNDHITGGEQLDIPQDGHA